MTAWQASETIRWCEATKCVRGQPVLKPGRPSVLNVDSEGVTMAKPKLRRCMDCERFLTERDRRSCCVVCRLMRSRTHAAREGGISSADEAIKRPRIAIYAARAERREPLFAA